MFPVSYALIAASLLVLFLYRRSNPLYRIPAVGYSAPLLSYIGAIQFMRHGREILQEGYAKHKGSAFRITMLDTWVVILCGAKLNEELRKLPDDQMSFIHAIEELVQTKYTIAPNVIDMPIHIAVIKGPLTRNIASLLPDVVDEIRVATEDSIPIHGDEWTSVPALETMMQIVCRASNRAFVGLPMCRNSEFLKTVLEFPRNVGLARFTLGLVPSIFKPLVGPWLPWPRRSLRKFSALMKPVVEERLRLLQDHDNDWSEKPNDYLTWLIEESRSIGQPLDLIVNAMLTSNFVAVHTSSTSITHALYHLAANPGYIHPLREEVESIVRTDGWTKPAVSRMMKLDSFLRESQRMNGISGVGVIRKAMKDVILSDGTVIPAGTLCGVAAECTHLDEDSYDDAAVFKPFRFADMREDESERIKYQYVNTSPEYVAFGHGKHACPGRFFAAYELKVVLAILLIKYDVKLEGDSGRPSNQWRGASILPNQSANVMFRRRQGLQSAL